jgi:uncharacterized protein (TIGR00251 family)
MKIKAIVKSNAKKDEVIQNADGSFLIRVNAPPVEGKANEKVVELLSDFLKKPKRCISIVSGLKGKIKIIEIQ